MIYGQLMGGLGNQLFIYAFCKTLAYEVGQDALLIFDSEDNRPLEISSFKLDSKIRIIKGEFNAESTNKRKYERYIILRKLIDHIPNKYFKDLITRYGQCAGIIYNPEGYFEIDYTRLKRCNDIIFCGFMQSNKYFEKIREQIVNEFAIDFDDLKDSIVKIKKENAICVHIRRGDYLSDRYKDRFLVCTDAYYKQAIDRMKVQYPDAVYYVFSDSIDWVKCNMPFLAKLNPVFVDNGGEEAVLKDFMMMKSCKHFIMSNSTLSWWAQYLGEYSDKHIIAPARWLNYGYDNRDIYMSNWELINV